MTLSNNNTAILLGLLNDAIGRFSAERDSLYRIVTSDEAMEVVISAFNVKLSACAKFRELASNQPVDENLIDLLATSEFNQIIEILRNAIDVLQKHVNFIAEQEEDEAPLANSFIEHHIVVLKVIRQELETMFSYL